MNGQVTKVLGLAISMLTAASVARAGSGLWLHVRVHEDERAKLTVNLPMVLVEGLASNLPTLRGPHGLRIGGYDLAELRSIWRRVSASPGAPGLVLEGPGGRIVVGRERDYLRVRTEERGDEIEVRIPAVVVDALLAGEEGELAVGAAVEALLLRGEGELVSVRGADDRVRVWVDATSQPEAEP